jgi:hypothetical protein
MLPRSTSTNPVVLSYYAMRRMVGYIALALPFALAAGYLVAILLESGHLPHPLLERSISDYYYTPMRDYYVGSLCAIAAFLACSRGYDLHDEVTGYFAAACVIGVACCPSFNPHSGSYTPLEFQLGLIHTAFAALMYLMLSYICIFLFRKSSPAKPFTRRKRDRNRIYAACGFIMVACMMTMVGLTIHSVVEQHHPSHWLFWCEALALGAFGIAWLTKGEGFMRDTRHQPDHVAGRSREVASS